MTRKPAYKKIKKDYQCKNLCNPFFARKPKGKKRGRTKWLILALLILLAALAWFWFASPFWRFNQIEINGLTRASRQSAEEIINQLASERKLLFFRQSNIFLFDEETAQEQILQEYNLIKVTLKKKLPKTLVITVQERPYAFIYQEGGNYFHASADAYIIRDPAVTEEDKTKYFTVENKTATSLIDAADRLSLKENYVNFILSLGNQLWGNPDLPLEKIIVDQEFNMATAKLVNGPAVYFSSSVGVQEQIDRLLLVKREKIKDNFSKTNYIDLRYGERIFINPDFN
jgi:cell division septal protein FtsQ